MIVRKIPHSQKASYKYRIGCSLPEAEGNETMWNSMIQSFQMIEGRKPSKGMLCSVGLIINTVYSL